DGGAWQTYSNPFTVVGGGMHNLTYRSADFLGNLEPERLLEFEVDVFAPATTFSATNSTEYGSVVVVGPESELVLSAEDPVGVASTAYKLDSESWEAYSSPVALNGTVSSSGEHELQYCSVDDFGNAEEKRTASFIMDIAGPLADAGCDISLENGSVATLSGNGSSDDNGIMNWTWRITCGGAESVLYGETVQFAFADPGNCTARLTVTDIAGKSAGDAVNITVENRTVMAAPVKSSLPLWLGALLVVASAVAVAGASASHRSKARKRLAEEMARRNIHTLPEMPDGAGIPRPPMNRRP
ncbi:PKD domain-containing protein, partial [Candidatus Uhrbacteria bacterium]|nr:PKD domain-containing protein [Candidatus Uhrbacteria bacterium]